MFGPQPQLALPTQLYSEYDNYMTGALLSCYNKTVMSESCFRVKLEERVFWQDHQLSGVLEYRKTEMGHLTHEMGIELRTSDFWDLGVEKKKLIFMRKSSECDSQSHSESYFRTWRIELWDLRSRSRAWQYFDAGYRGITLIMLIILIWR